MTTTSPVATFKALPGGHARMNIVDGRDTNTLTRAELIDLAAAATATAAQLTAPTPAQTVGQIRRNPAP